LSSWSIFSIAELPKVLKAVKAFQQLPEAATLAAANKRIVNIIKKAGVEHMDADVVKLVEPAEQTLFDAMQKLKPEIDSRFAARDYTGALLLLAGLKQPVDTFFDQVMVMAEDEALRTNRLALLGDLKKLMNKVADISRLAA
jgi:glycyl-tRNA synthetase beta chain